MTLPWKRILIPLDASQEADVALVAIEPLLRLSSPEIVLLGVMDDDMLKRRVQSHLDYVAGQFHARGVRSAVAFRDGKPASEILAFAAEHAVDLIAMSTHGRGGMKRLFVGSVTEEVLRHATLPILVCRPRLAAPEWTRIVVALDGSERAEAILSDAAPIAAAQGIPLDLVRVAMPAMIVGATGELPLTLPLEDCTPYLQSVSERLGTAGVKAHPVCLSGPAAGEIVSYAEERKAGLICLTTHGRTGLSRTLLGSVAEDILRHAPCPVLVRRTVASEKPAVPVSHVD